MKCIHKWVGAGLRSKGQPVFCCKCFTPGRRISPRKFMALPETKQQHWLILNKNGLGAGTHKFRIVYAKSMGATVKCQYDNLSIAFGVDDLNSLTLNLFDEIDYVYENFPDETEEFPPVWQLDVDYRFLTVLRSLRHADQRGTIHWECTDERSVPKVGRAVSGGGPVRRQVSRT